MNRINLWFFYDAGASMHRLSRIESASARIDIAIAVIESHRAVTALLDDELLNLDISRRPGRYLVEKIEAVRSTIFPTEPNQTIQEIRPDQIEDVKTAIKQFEDALNLDFERVNAFAVGRIGIYSTPDLLENADKAFPKHVAALIPDTAKTDFRSAGRCLAFGLATACGFHTIRAAEAVIHEYYVTVTGNTPKRKDRNWGAYVRNLNTHLKKNPTSRADPKLVALIDQVREHHRNPVMHPEIVLLPEQAQSLFNISLAVITSFAEATFALMVSP